LLAKGGGLEDEVTLELRAGSKEGGISLVALGKERERERTRHRENEGVQISLLL
jgi:hypothetical protein